LEFQIINTHLDLNSILTGTGTTLGMVHLLNIEYFPNNPQLNLIVNILSPIITGVMIGFLKELHHEYKKRKK